MKGKKEHLISSFGVDNEGKKVNLFGAASRKRKRSSCLVQW
jgi:hypothetical protein